MLPAPTSPPPPESDGHLAARAVACRDAFAALVDRHFSMCHAVALARLGDPEAAEEIAQETFLRAYLHLNELRDPDRVAPWLARIARNLAENRRARGASRRRLADMVPLDDSALAQAASSAAASPAAVAAAPSVRDTLAARQEADLVRAAVARLPEESREVVTLHFVEGWSPSEIARRLGLYPSSVGRRLDKALARLRAELGGLLDRDAAAAAGPAVAAAMAPAPASKRRAAAAIAAVAALPQAARAALLAESVATGGACAGGGSAGISMLGHILFGGGRTMMMAKVSGMAAVAAMAAWGTMTGGPTGGAAVGATGRGALVVAAAGATPTGAGAGAGGGNGGGPAAPSAGAAAAGAASVPASPDGRALDPATATAPAAAVATASRAPARRTSRTTSTVAVVAVTPDPAEQAVRQRVSRVRSDLRSLATGLETYYVDNNTYPAAVVDGSIRKPGPGEARVPSFLPGANPATLTSPIAYITSYFDDAFGRDGQTFGYWNAPDAKGQSNGWIVFSPGPDGKFDLDWTKYDPKVPQPSPEIIADVYDPTNGTWSRGDIVRVKQ